MLSVYIHHVAKSDEERDPHDHPWDFISLVLKNGYTEKVWDSKDRNSFKTFVRNPGKIVYHKVSQFHQLKLNSEGAWTLVVAGRRKHNLWGYLTENGWVDNVTYRKQKNSKNLA